MAISRLSVLKFLELGLTITCIGLHLHSFGSPADINENMVATGTFGGYIIIMIAVFIGLFANQPLGKKVDIFLSLAGCALFVASGALIIRYVDSAYTTKSFRDTSLAKGSLAIINGAVFLLDAVFSFRD